MENNPNTPPNVTAAITALRTVIDALANEIDYMTGDENETLGTWREMVDTPRTDIRELIDDAAYNIREIEGLGQAIRDVAHDALRDARPHIDEIEMWLEAQEENR
jgi:hypothetical protein